MRKISLFTGLVVVLLAGCGGGNKEGVPVEGQVVKDGAPLTLGEEESVTITLTAGDGTTTYKTGASPDGKFNLQTPSGDPIPVGKYKVHYVYQRPASPYTKKPPFKFSKELPEPWEVSPSNRTFTLDVGKGAGKGAGKE